MTESIEQELNRVYSELEKQKKAREQTNKKIEAMLKEVQSKLEAEI